MFKLALGSDNVFLVVSPRGTDLGPLVQGGLLAILFILPLGLILWLYRYELRLVTRLQAIGLLALRLVILLIIVGMVSLQPHVAEVSVEEMPSRVRIAVDVSSSMNVADVQRDAGEKARLARILKLPEAAVDELSRKAIAARLLSRDGSNLLERLAERHQVEIVGFAENASEMQLPELDRAASREVAGTDISQPLKATPAGRSQPLLGIVLLSDGQHNVGSAPFAQAENLGRQRVPIYPVVIGSMTAPSDVVVAEVQTPAKAYKDATIPIEIRCKVANMPPQELAVEMQFDGRPALPEHRQIIKHPGGHAVHAVRFQAKMGEVGTHTLAVKVSSQTQEISLANNEATRIIRVVQDKAKVLLVDGEARWEYHYLATMLARDPTLQLDRVVFSQPRIGSLPQQELEKLGHAKTRLPEAKADARQIDPLSAYDCILLGDVSPEQLPIADRRRIEKYVAERGGTLILIAGKRHLPLGYTEPDDPFVKLLPLTEPRVLAPEKGFQLDVSPEGKHRPFLHLEPDQPAFTWPQLPGHFWGIIGKRKPAASVLLTARPADVVAGPAEDRGIFLQQHYGSGRVLFVGLDSTWRWRYRVGDAYHHRFWGQLVRWAAADKLLPAGNAFIRYGSREPVYTTGQEVELAVRVAETLPPLDDKARAQVKLHRQRAGGAEELVAEVPLAGNVQQKQLFEAKVRDLPTGTYRIELDIPSYREQLAIPADDGSAPASGRDQFRVLPIEPKEWFDLATNVKLLQTLANASDGRLLWPEEVEQLLDRLARRVERTEHRHESRPWQDEPAVWWLLGVLLSLLTLEWGWRKWLELP